jgi:hypothetical protein
MSQRNDPEDYLFLQNEDRPTPLDLKIRFPILLHQSSRYADT